MKGRLATVGSRPAPPAPPLIVAGLRRAGVAAALVLVERFGPQQVLGWDAMDDPFTRAAAARLRAAGVSCAFGTSGTELLDRSPPPRSIVKSPGIPADVPLLATAAVRGLAIIDELELGWRLDSRPVVAITGTNGKSTVASLALAVLDRGGLDSALAGNTLLGPPLSGLDADAGEVVVAEVSSFQLEGCPELLPEAAVLTNLVPHHLGRHRTAGAYAECKRRLFVRGERSTGLAVVDSADDLGRRLGAEVEARGGTAIRFGLTSDSDVRVVGCDWTLDGGQVTLAADGRELTVRSGLPGRHNALNVGAALALALGLGIDTQAAAAAITQAPQVAGRFELVGSEAPFDVVVDFAHNPDGLAATIETARAVTARRQGRVVAVVSAVRVVNDPDERRAMGRTAAALADRLILTTERRGLRDPRGVLSELVQGARAADPRCEVVPDRGEAIGRALSLADAGDVVLVLGRGAEGGWLFDADDQPRRFDDRQAAREGLMRLGFAAGSGADG